MRVYYTRSALGLSSLELGLKKNSLKTQIENRIEADCGEHRRIGLTE